MRELRDVVLGVGGLMLLVYAHIGMVSLIDNWVTTPVAIGLLLLGEALVVLVVALIGAKLSHDPPALHPVDHYDDHLGSPKEFPDPILARTANLLNNARKQLHSQLAELTQPDANPVLREESAGMVHVVSRNSYLYLSRTPAPAPVDHELASFGHEQVRTLALRWTVSVKSSRGHLRPKTITLTINANAEPQLSVDTINAKYPGTPEGFAAMLNEVSHRPN